MNGWTFVYLMVVLKIPIALLLYLVWWAVHQVPDAEPETQSGDGGSGRRLHPRGPLPRHPRRGPHGGAAPTPPPRTRTVVAGGRRLERH